LGILPIPWGYEGAKLFKAPSFVTKGPSKEGREGLRPFPFKRRKNHSRDLFWAFNWLALFNSE